MHSLIAYNRTEIYNMYFLKYASLIVLVVIEVNWI